MDARHCDLYGLLFKSLGAIVSVNKRTSHLLPSASIVDFPMSTRPPNKHRDKGVALTKASVAKLMLPAGKTDIIYFDSALPNFGLRIRAGGKRVYIAQYRDEHGSTRRVTIGSADVLDPDQARTRARKILGGVAIGNDPANRNGTQGRRRSLSTWCRRSCYMPGRSSVPSPSARPSGTSKVLRATRLDAGEGARTAQQLPVCTTA